MADREGPIHKAILRYLGTIRGAFVFHPANEIASKALRGFGQRGQQAAMRAQVKAKALGMVPGIPDLVMVLDGQAYAFEVKAEGNYQQPNQKAVMEAWRAAGGFYAVVRSIDDVRESLSEWAVPAAPLDMVSIPLRGSIS